MAIWVCKYCKKEMGKPKKEVNPRTLFHSCGNGNTGLFEIKSKIIHVGNLGEAVITKNSNGTTVYYVKEEDGTKSWQLLPNEHSDTILKTARVMPLKLKGY